MPITLGMFDTSYAHIGERLRALGLDIAVRTFSKDGTFLVDGKKVPPSEVVLDYAWLTSHINADGFRDRAFDIVLGCKSIGVLQTFNAGLDHPFYRASCRARARASATAARRAWRSPSTCWGRCSPYSSRSNSSAACRPASSGRSRRSARSGGPTG